MCLASGFRELALINGVLLSIFTLQASILLMLTCLLTGLFQNKPPRVVRFKLTSSVDCCCQLFCMYCTFRCLNMALRLLNPDPPLLCSLRTGSFHFDPVLVNKHSWRGAPRRIASFPGSRSRTIKSLGTRLRGWHVLNRCTVGKEFSS